MSRAVFTGPEPGEPARTIGRRVRTTVVAGSVLIVAVGAAGWALIRGPLSDPTPDVRRQAVPTGTARVIRSTIVASEQDSGTLGYDQSQTVDDRLAGTITWLPATGSVIRTGHRLFRVDDHDVVLLTGRTPAWRAFAPGMSDGTDVEELERALVALAYDPNHAITVDDHFSAATAAAVRRFQGAHGVPAPRRDGRIPLGEVVFAPGPVRIATLRTTPGAAATSGMAVLSITSTRPVVQVDLPADVRPHVHIGDPVTITLPTTQTTSGRIIRIGSPNVMADQSQGQNGNQGQNRPPSGGQQPPPTVPVVVGLSHPSLAHGLDQTPVQISIATQTHRDVLTVPISALLARPGGGYEIVLVQGATRPRVPVRPGLFDEFGGTVEISGPGITEGTTVEVPNS